ncbi:S8 family serine peptidase [Yeosuana sp.]|uniref:S8 family serine peptidase n=1 Tax=Yeosuana sp. TaxID=2529388 RepID=UPI004054AD9B
MKNSYIIHTVLLLAILVAMSFSLSQQSKFYYAYTEKIFLKELDNKLIVRYNKNKKTDKKLISSYLELGDEFIKWEDDSTCVVVTDPSKMKNIKDKILKQGDVKTLNMMYSVNSGLEMGVTDEFIVKFKENVSQKEIEKLHKNHGVIAVKTTDIYQLLKVPNGADALEIANIYPLPQSFT